MYQWSVTAFIPSGFVESMRAFPVGVEYRQKESGFPEDVDVARYLCGTW